MSQQQLRSHTADTCKLIKLSKDSNWNMTTVNRLKYSFIIYFHLPSRCWWKMFFFFFKIKTKHRYVWTKREFTEEGSLLGQLVEQVCINFSLFFLERGCISLPLRHFYSIVLFLTLPSYFSCCLNNCPAGVVRVLLRLVLIDRRWTELSDGSSQCFSYRTLSKAETGRRLMWNVGMAFLL